jgi:alpha-galactosidase-like protein
VEVVVSSHLSEAEASGVVRLRVPAGWRVDPASRPYTLRPGDHRRFGAVVVPPALAAAGVYFVSARIEHAVRLVEDVATVSVGDPAGSGDRPAGGGRTQVRGAVGVPAQRFAGETALDQELTEQAPTGRWDDRPRRSVVAALRPDTGLAVDVVKPEVVVRPGARASVGVTVVNLTRDEIHGELRLVSPWGTWDALPDVARDFAVDAGEQLETEFAVVVPADAEAGETWALAKVMWFGRCQYTSAVRLVVTA